MASDEARSFLTQRYSRPMGGLLAGGLVAVLTVVDLAAGPRANVSILYILALVIFAQAGPRRGFILVGGAVLVVLTYACFLIKHRAHVLSSDDWVPSFTNRSFAAGSNAAAAVLLYSWIHFRAYWESRHEHLSATDMDGFIVNQVFQSLDRVVAVLLCAILTAGIVAMDFVEPKEFNFPILYALPVIIAGLTERRLILWSTVLVVVALTFAGYFWGPPATAGMPLQSLLNNRLLASCMLAGTGVVMHLGWRSRGLSARIEDSIMGRAFGC